MLNEYIKDTENPNNNFNLAYEYECKDQYASAISFYLRASERTYDLNLKYESLIRMVLCFLKFEDYNETIETLLKRIISAAPNRPEAYFLLSRFYEYNTRYHEAYFISSIALKFCDFNTEKKFKFDIDYPGKYGLLFEKGVSAWWIGAYDESKEILYDLLLNYNLNETYKKNLKENINNIGTPNRFSILYYRNEREPKYKFPNIELIDQNYSQVYQDLFVLCKLNGKKQGYYLEIGSNDPFVNSNTYLLESKFEWKGISIEIDCDMVDKFLNNRKNIVLNMDARTIDYDGLLSSMRYPSNIDYLSIDCEPSETSFSVLKKIISSKYTFNVITFEHDYYVDFNNVRDDSREFLLKNDYVLIEKDVTFDNINSFEDWYVHKSLL
jgi:hypothetical protein